MALGLWCSISALWWDSHRGRDGSEPRPLWLCTPWLFSLPCSIRYALLSFFLGGHLRMSRPKCRHFSCSFKSTAVSKFSSVIQLCQTLCDPMHCSTPGLPVHHQLPEFTQTHVHWVSDTIQPSHPLSSPSVPALNLSQHQGLFQWVSSLHHVARGLKFQLQHQSFKWIFRTDFL